MQGLKEFYGLYKVLAFDDQAGMVTSTNWYIAYYSVPESVNDRENHILVADLKTRLK